MKILIELPKDVLKLAAEQALQKKWSRKQFIEETVIKAVREAEIALKEGGKGK